MKSNNISNTHAIAWIKTNKYHFLAWMIFIVYESSAVFIATGISGHILSYLLHYALNIGLFYFHAHWILPTAFKKKVHQIWLVPLMIAFEISLYLIVSYSFDLALLNFTTIFSGNQVHFDRRFISGGLWRAIYFLGFSSGYYFLKNYLRELRITSMLQQQALEQIIRENQMTIELAKAKNAYLRAQINPHFLFNTLNFIYNQTRKTNDVAASAILLLSGIMRYAIEEVQDSVLKPLAGEIQQVKNLIALWQIRQRAMTYIEFKVDEEVDHFLFIPLVLLTLTENVLKHGDLTNANHPASITVTISERLFKVVTRNLVSDQSSDTGFHSGLQNIEQRLDYAFGETGAFKYSKEPNGYFEVSVEIDTPKQ